MTEKSKNSIGMFDFSRGFLVLAVVAVHSLTLFFKYWEPQETIRWWYIFFLIVKPIIYGAVPMFFMMSGYGFRKKKMKNSIMERCKYIVKPYVITGVIVTILILCKAIVAHHEVKEELWHYTLPFVLGLCPGEMQYGEHYIGSIGPMWFLVVLMISWIILNLFFHLKSDVSTALCIIAAVALCTRLPFYSFIPYCLVQSLVCTAYLYMGYKIKKKNLLHQKVSKQNFIILLLISIGTIMFGNIEVSQNVWALGMLDFIASAIAGFLLLKLCHAVNQMQMPRRVAAVVRTAGKYSLYILCVHSIEYLAFPWARVAAYFEGHKVIGILVTFGIRMVIITCGCRVIIQYINWKRKKRRA